MTQAKKVSGLNTILNLPEQNLPETNTLAYFVAKSVTAFDNTDTCGLYYKYIFMQLGFSMSRVTSPVEH
jgi:hypothetical protein